MTEQILYSVADGIATITLNRPDRMNAMLPGMGELYADLLQRADADPEVRVIVVTGAGKGFCAGADLSVLAEGTAGLNKYVDEQSVETLPFRGGVGLPAPPTSKTVPAKSQESNSPSPAQTAFRVCDVAVVNRNWSQPKGRSGSG
jgi:hypothetical protein